jgi:hypothetical protein
MWLEPNLKLEVVGRESDRTTVGLDLSGLQMTEQAYIYFLLFS